MASSFERSAVEKESLIFSDPEKAQEFTGRLEKRAEKGFSRESRREQLAEELVHEFEQEGEGVDRITHPWEHTSQEHEEVQQLVTIAFEKDLPTALRAARSSDHYPRNVDLLHDLLTTEMYDLVQESQLNKQATGLLWITTLGVSLLLLVIVILVLIT